MLFDSPDDEISVRFSQLIWEERDTIKDVENPCLRRLEELFQEQERATPGSSYASSNGTPCAPDTWAPNASEESSLTPPSLSFEKLWDLSKRMDVKSAAQFFNMSGTTFKLNCRRLGISSWPYRTFQSYNALLESETSSEKVKVSQFCGLLTYFSKKKVPSQESVRRIIRESASHRFSFSRGEHQNVRKAMQAMYRTTHARKKKKTEKDQPGARNRQPKCT